MFILHYQLPEEIKGLYIIGLSYILHCIFILYTFTYYCYSYSNSSFVQAAIFNFKI